MTGAPERLAWRRALGRLARRVPVILGVTYAIWLVALWFMQTGMLFPAKYAGTPRAAPPQDAVVLRVPVEGGNVEGWFLPAAPASAAAPLVVICHGNAELIDQQLWLAERFRARGFAVLLPEYRGYGRNPGSPGEAAIVADAVAFLDAALAQPGIDPARVVIYGRSVGGGVAAQLAARQPPAAIILESTFTSVAARAWHYGAPPLLVRNPFHSDRVLPQLHKPALIFHGSRDSIISVTEGRALHALTPGSTYVELDTDHNDFPARTRIPQYWSAVDRFLAEAGIVPGG